MFTAKMPVIRQSQARFPFWGAAIRIINGLDPLGMQTTSEATYSLLLPGISNLTNRIRYYGFYCWLLNFYYNRERVGNSIEQFRFIRRAELMIALIMQSKHPQVNQITGSRYAANWLSQTWGSFSLAEGADYVKGIEKSLYWKHKSGAFGQYYLGAMKALNLVTVGTDNAYDELYNITKASLKHLICGQSLAEAFEATLTEEVKELFYQNIRKGELARSDIDHLAEYFTISQVDPFTKEGELYIQMLRMHDYPAQMNENITTFHRRDTLIGLIDTATNNKNEFNTHAYLTRCYTHQFGGGAIPATTTEVGWYSYMLNEYWQFACGSILWALIAHLEELGEPQYLPNFVNHFVTHVIEVMDRNLYTVDLLGEVLTQFSPNRAEENYVQAITSNICAKAAIPAAVNGFYLLFQLLTNNADCIQQIGHFISEHGTRRDGNMVDGLQFITNAKGQKFSEFIEQFIYRYVVNRHRLVAMRKMGSGYQATNKFIVEDNFIRPIENFTPRFTSPRMGAVTNLLFDLQLIKNEGSSLSLSGIEELFGSEKINFTAPS